MFTPLLDLAPDAYEAIIAAFIVLGLIQSLALRRKWYQADALKKVVAKVAVAGVKAIAASLLEISKLERRAILASARADAMQERAEQAERELMEAAADHDDAADDARAFDPKSFFFGDTHFATREPARNNPDVLRSLFAMLDGKGRNGSALDDLIGGRHGPQVTVVNGGDFLDGPYTNNLAPDQPSYVDRGDIESFLRRGDLAGLEKSLDAKVIDIQVIGPDGNPIEGAEKEALIRQFFGADFGRTPGFSVDAATFGRQVHEEIERNLANNEAARTFGPESGAAGDTLKMTLDPHARSHFVDESCSTQEPRSYPASSPRAG